MATIKIETDMNTDAARALFAWGAAVADIIINAPGDRKLRLGDLTPAGVHYVADYGVNQSLQDCVSGVKAATKAAYDDYGKDAKATAAFDKLAKDAGLKDVDTVTLEAVINGIINAKQTARFDAIVASSLPVRESTGRLSGKDAWIAKAALDEIKAKHEAAGKDMPKGQALKDLTAKYVAAKADYFTGLWNDHNTRLANAATTADEILGF